jgi:hypothetical protein
MFKLIAIRSRRTDIAISISFLVAIRESDLKNEVKLANTRLVFELHKQSEGNLHTIRQLV